MPTTKKAKKKTKKAPPAAIIEKVLGEVVWVSADRAYCDCPGAALHTNKDSKRDCILYLDTVPTIHCLHSSCGHLVEAKNKELRTALADSSTEGIVKVSPKQKKELVQLRDTMERHRLRAKLSLPRLLEDYKWTYAQIVKDSPTKIPTDRTEQTRLFLPKYPAEGKIWIGGQRDSGQEHDAKHFKTRDEWMKEEIFNHAYICPSTFKEASISRSNKNVFARPFLVVESDVLKKDEVGAIFRWLNHKVGLELVAVVDTAGKSLHGWFSLPENTDLTEMKLILPALGCDPKLFTESQPVRLPGGLRSFPQTTGLSETKIQNLIYLK